MKESNMKLMLDLISEIQDSKMLKGYSSFMEGEDKDSILKLFDASSIIPIEPLVDFYHEFKEYKFEYKLKTNVNSIKYIDKELDIIYGSCNFLNLKRVLEVAVESGIFVIDYLEEEFYVGLRVLKKNIIDNVLLYDFDTKKWQPLGLTFYDYLNALKMFRGFNKWQWIFSEKNNRERELISHYIPQIFVISENEIQDYLKKLI